MAGGPRDIVVESIGVGYRHSIGFSVDRPRGSGDFLLVHFRAPGAIRLRSGLVHVPAGHCIIFTPRHPHHYGGDGVGLDNDWVHFAGDGVRHTLRRLGLLINRPFAPRQAHLLSRLLSEIQQEWTEREENWARVCSLLMQRVLTVLARSTAVPGATTPGVTDPHPELMALRQAIIADPQEGWTVPRMARRVHLSPSRFAAVFTARFGDSPRSWVIACRIERAKWYLTSSTLPIKHVADACGFSSVHYFSRMFRRRVGCTPSAFRQSAG